MTKTLPLFLVLAWAPAVFAEDQAAPAFGQIERVDPRFDALISPDAVLEKLADGFEWSEGPVWVGEDACLLFSDIPRNSIMKWKEGQGISLFLKPSGYTGTGPRGGEPGSNGLLRDADGRLVLCQHGDRRIVRVERDGSWTTLVDRYDGKRLNSPNDAVFHSSGDLYFTDPPYGLAGPERETLGELGFCGVYRLSKDGKLTLLTKEMTRPNGIAFSPDEKTLYVAQSDPQKAIWMAFDVLADGTIGNGRTFYDATPWQKTLKGLPDGMKVDCRGNLFATGPGGVNVFAPDGTFLGRINPGVPTANCAFGDDGSTLYITADMFLCRIRTKTKGLRSKESSPSARAGLTNAFFAFDNGLHGIQDPPKVLKELGYSGVGLSGLNIAGPVKRYQEAGLKVFSTYVGCHLDKTPPYDPKMRETIEELKGTDVILWLTVLGGKRGEEDDKAAAVVREIADLAAASNLRVALYPHTGFYVATTADALRVVKKVDRKNVGATINLCHELMTDQGKKLDATIEEVMPHLFLVSINGADDKQPGYSWDRLIQPLGRGDFDVGAFLQKLVTAGYTGPVGLQCYAVKGDPVENLTQSIRAWKEYGSRIASEEK